MRENHARNGLKKVAESVKFLQKVLEIFITAAPIRC